MVSDAQVRKRVYESGILDRTFYTGEEFFPTEISAQLKRDKAKRIHFRLDGKRFRPVTLTYLKNFFEEVTVRSAGIVAVTHGPSKTDKRRYTQYCAGIIARSEKLGVFKADLDFCVYFKKKTPK